MGRKRLMSGDKRRIYGLAMSEEQSEKLQMIADGMGVDRSVILRGLIDAARVETRVESRTVMMLYLGDKEVTL
jgi:hypothetical protein